MTVDNEIVGFLHVVANLDELTERLLETVIVAAILTIVLIVLSFLFASMLNGLITRPIIAVSNSMKEVGEREDFSIRIETNREDEIGDVIQGFNNMLSRIQARDQELAPIKIRTEDCSRLKIKKKLVTGVIVGKAELYDVKKYNLIKEIKKDQKFHFSSKKFNGKTFGFMLKNSKQLRIPIPWKGQLGFFDVELPKSKIKNKEIVSEIIDEEYRYQWIGRH